MRGGGLWKHVGRKGVFGGAVETHWTQTAHLERLWGVVREAPNVAANLPEVSMLLGLFWGSFGVPWDPVGVPFRSLLGPRGSLLASIWHLWGCPGGRLGN